MKMYRFATSRILIRAGLALCLLVPLGAQDLETEGQALADSMLQALGGDAFLNIRSMVERGRVYSFKFGQLSGLSPAVLRTRYIDLDPSETGSKLSIEQCQGLGKDEEYYDLIRDDGIWEVTYHGRKQLEGDSLERFRDNMMHDVLYIARVRFHEPGMIFEAHGARVIENVPVDVLDIIDKENRVVRVYLNQHTHLPMRADWTWRDPKTHVRNDEVVRYSLFKEVDGVMWPHQMSRERNEDKSYEKFDETVEINPEIDPKYFAIPEEGAKPFK